MLETARLAYFRSALSGLRYLESREPTQRRFGPDADVLWRTFATRQMSEVDRLELLIRDADRQWRGAFGARQVFELPTGSDDDAFGPTWERASPAVVRDLFRAAFEAEAPNEPRSVVDAWSAAWDRPLTEVSMAVEPQEQITLAGASAIASAILHFSEHPELAWHRQIAVVATEPAERQLAGLAAPLLAAEGLTTLRTHAPEGRRVISSPDLRDSDRAALSPEAPQAI